MGTGTLWQLADALRSRRPDIERFLERALANGELVRDARGFLTPVAAPPDPDLMLSFHASWREMSPTGFLAKPLDLERVDRLGLGAIFETLCSLDLPEFPPCWLSDRFVVSYYFADAADLRNYHKAPSPNMGREIHDLCVASLLQLHELEPSLRDAVNRADAAVQAFSMAQRYATACSELAARWSLHVEDLPQAIPDGLIRGPQALFSDPKPANLLVPRRRREDGRGLRGAPWVRVDLDMLLWEAPLVLQFALVYFAHPVTFEGGVGLDEAFGIQFDRMRAAAAQACGASDQEIEFTVWYHLMRNFTSASKQGQLEKAHAMAGMLRAAGRRFATLGMKASALRSLDDMLQTASRAGIRDRNLGLPSDVEVLS